jgi:hypothetical protein
MLLRYNFILFCAELAQGSKQFIRPTGFVYETIKIGYLTGRTTMYASYYHQRCRIVIIDIVEGVTIAAKQ